MTEIFAENEHKSDEWKKKLEEAEQFEDFVSKFLLEEGIDIGLFRDRNQYIGESELGVEIKLDKRFRSTNKLYFEYAERQKEKKWVNSGFLKEDNTEYIVIGDYNDLFFFKKKDIINQHEKKENIQVETETSKGMLITLEKSKEISIPLSSFIILLTEKLNAGGNKMANNETIKGLVKAVRKDKRGVMLDNEKWYSNQYLAEPVSANKGDEVEITLNSKGYLQEIKVLKSSPTGIGQTPDERKETRLLVDVGNTLRDAVDLTIAVMNNSKEPVIAEEVLKKASEICAKEFLNLKKILSEEPEEN